MLITIVVTTLLVIVCVLIHYNVLSGITALRHRREHKHRRWIVFLILAAIAAHIIEVIVFGLGYAFLAQFESAGRLVSATEASGDFLYFSAVVYTSLGFGDITPAGNLRFTAGVETLTGLVLIAWTSSLVFVEMQAYWSVNHSD